MLTESETQWLRDRELSPRPYCASCINAKICAKTRKQCWCPTDGIDRYDAHILQDALEFSERVTAKLVRWDNEYHKGDRLCPYGDTDLDSYIPLCHCTDFCQIHPKLGCIAAKLAWVQLHVEEEMDGENS